MLDWQDLFERQHAAGETTVLLLELPSFVTSRIGYTALS
jgi:hypothetical protein